MRDENGFVVQFSRSFSNMLGYSYEETAHLNVLDWDSLIPRQDLINVAREIINTPRVFETRHRRKDGSYFDVEASVQYRATDGGQLVTFLRDISERKQAEKERVKLENQLQQARKMEAIGQLAESLVIASP